MELYGLSIFRPHHRQRSWPNRTVSMHLIEQWIPGKPDTRYPPSLQIDMPQPSQLPRGDPTLPAGMCLSISNESVVSAGFIASPKIAMPSFVIVYASPATAPRWIHFVIARHRCPRADLD